MARRSYRRSYRNRPKNDMTWQRVAAIQEYPLEQDSDQPFYVLAMKPGIGIGDNFREFDSPSVLERIRGSVFHSIRGGTGTGNGVAPLNLAMFRVPAEITNALGSIDMPNLFDNTEGDDYPLFYSSICDTIGGQTNPEHEIDVKAKRKTEVGTAFVIGGTVRVPSIGTAAELDFTINLSFLWKRS